MAISLTKTKIVDGQYFSTIGQAASGSGHHRGQWETVQTPSQMVTDNRGDTNGAVLSYVIPRAVAQGIGSIS
jgi:hypothetical protein